MRTRPSARPTIEQNETARVRAVAVARAALAAVADGRWGATPGARTAYQLATGVLESDATLGIVCEADLADLHVASMAMGAHAIAMHARVDMVSGLAPIDRALDHDMLVMAIDEDLIPAYALITSDMPTR